MQKVLRMTTSEPHGDSLRAEVIGWSCDDPDYVLPEQVWWPHNKIGLVRSHATNHSYATVLQALADGWKLLGVPVKYEHQYHNGSVTEFQWWLIKD